MLSFNSFGTLLQAEDSYLTIFECKINIKAIGKLKLRLILYFLLVTYIYYNYCDVMRTLTYYNVWNYKEL